MPKMMITGDYKPIQIRLEQHEFNALYDKLGLKIHEYIRCCIQLASENHQIYIKEVRNKMMWMEKTMHYAPWFVRNESVHLKAPERSIPRWVQG